MPDISSNIRILFISILSALGGCATEQSKKTTETKVFVNISTEKISNCELTKRDLSMPWEKREYWCSTASRLDLLNKRNMDNSKDLEKIEASRQVLKNTSARLDKVVSEMEEEIKEDVEFTHPVRFENNEKYGDNVSSMGKIEVDIRYIKKAIDDGTDVRTIWFAKNITVLGHQGEKNLSALIPIIKDSTHVYLRGYIKEGELEETGHMSSEAMSVARSLSIRKKLITEGNIDKKKITILHYKPGTTGRYVEVSFNG